MGFFVCRIIDQSQSALQTTRLSNMAGKLWFTPSHFLLKISPQYRANRDYSFITDIDIFQDDPEDGLEGGECS